MLAKLPDNWDDVIARLQNVVPMPSNWDLEHIGSKIARHAGEEMEPDSLVLVLARAWTEAWGGTSANPFETALSSRLMVLMLPRYIDALIDDTTFADAAKQVFKDAIESARSARDMSSS